MAFCLPINETYVLENRDLKNLLQLKDAFYRFLKHQDGKDNTVNLPI